MVHANIASVETDVVLVFIAFVLCHTEQHSVLHLQPELAVFVFQYSFILLLGKRWKLKPTSIKEDIRNVYIKLQG